MKSNLQKVLNGNLTANLMNTLSVLSAGNDSASGFYTVSDVVNQYVARCHSALNLSKADHSELMKRASTAFSQTLNNHRSDLRRSNNRISAAYTSHWPSKAGYGYRIGTLITPGINSDIVKESKLLTKQAEEIAKKSSCNDYNPDARVTDPTANRGNR